MSIIQTIFLFLSNSINLIRDKSIFFSRATITIFFVRIFFVTIFFVRIFFVTILLVTILLVTVNNLNFPFPTFHFCFILLFLYFQKQKITIKKLTGLTVIVFITPLVLHFIIFSMPYLLDNLPFILFEFNHLIQRILVFFFSKVYQVLLKIFSKKGFIDILTNICILSVIKLVLLGSLSILDIVSNLFITNCLFSLTIDFYSITLIKVVIPYVEKLYTSIIKPYFNSCFPTIFCDSPEEVSKLFSELPFHIVDRNDMVKECRTSTNYKSREDLMAEFKAFRLKISLYTPSFSVSMQSGHESNIEIDEPSRGQLDKGKKRALDNTQEEAYSKRAKIDLGNTKSNTVTLEDFYGEDWDLHSIYKKINNLMEDPKYNSRWTINKLFEDKEVQSNFYRYIEAYQLTKYKNVWKTTLVHLKSNLEEEIKTHYDTYSIKKEDFTENGLNLLLVHEKITKFMLNNDFNSKWRINKLKFEPFSLRRPFYANLEALNLKNCKYISDLTISALRNLIEERCCMVVYRPNSISWDKRNSITRDDFTSDGLNFESIYNKIKQSMEDGQYEKRDTINKLFPPRSPLATNFCTKLQTLNLTNITDLKKINNIRIQTLINSLEKVVDVPSTKNNSITREDLIGEDWDLHSIYEKITNVIRTNNFNKKSKIGKLEFEPDILRKEFYSYIKAFKLIKLQITSDTTILSLKNIIKKELDIPDD